MEHRGPLMEDYAANPRKFKWPDIRVKLYFPKIVSDKWKQFLKKYDYPEEKVKSIIKSFFSKGRVNNTL